MKTLPPSPITRFHQRGAAFLVMLVVMIVGISFFLVSSLSKVALQTARNEISSDMLAQTKEVIIGYALNGTAGAQPPGNLTYPDVLSEGAPNYDGVSEGGCLDATKTLSTPIPGLPLKSSGSIMRCLGRLPWKTFNLPIPSPSENDPTGVMPWHAVSANMIDASPFNSELSSNPTPPHPWLTVRDMKGNVVSNRVAFIIMIPGSTLPGQTRPLSALQGGPGLNGASHYLDSITVPATCSLPCVPGTYNNFDMDDDFIMGDEHRWIDDPANPGKQVEDATYQFNDKLLFVTIDELMPLIEKRIVREVKSCLDDYAASAANTNHRYPWPARTSDAAAFTTRTGEYDVWFGRIPEILNISTTSGGTPPTGTLLTYIQAVQTALDNYTASQTAGNLNDLNNAGHTLEDFISSGPAHIAGDTAKNCAGMSCTTTLQSQLYTAMGMGTPDPTMPTTWTPACTAFFTSPLSYWADWRDLVFYQVAAGYQPQPGASGTFTALQIAGSGNTNAGSGTTYRAAVLLAGKKLGTQTRAAPYATPPNDYLSNTTSEQSADPGFVSNAHNSAGSSTSFITYKTSDPYYQSVNDLVVCVDGKNNCQ